MGSLRDSPRSALVSLLQAAYSGERAAAYAYRGHWRSVRGATDKARIKAIEEDEWNHRARVGEQLKELGATPRRSLEIRALCIGRTLGLLCHLGGWLAPMIGAGKLESKNVGEYESAARLAAQSGHPEWVDCFLEMAEVEWDHEAFFRSRILSHWLGRRLRLWPELPPRPEIRAGFQREQAQNSLEPELEETGFPSTPRLGVPAGGRARGM